jgi:hypothetical protein
VTGTHGSQRHLGNAWVADKDNWQDIDIESGANVTDLSQRVDLAPYLTPHSDIVALMVMEHQIAMHNLFTAAHIEWRLYWREVQADHPATPDVLSDEAAARLGMIAKRVANGLLMQDAAELTDKIRGTSDFRDEFVKQGPVDQQGRCLRELDLNQRLFRYACSYMVDSAAFDGLDHRLREAVCQRLAAALEAPSPGDPDLAARRQVTLEILKSTKPECFPPVGPGAAGREDAEPEAIR